MRISLRTLLIATCLSAASTAALAGQSLLSHAKDLGPVDAASPIEITLWMKLHDQRGLDTLVAAQQAGKAGYLTAEQVLAQHAPSAADVARVAALLKAEGFTVSGFGQQNMFVRASGTVARVQGVFNVELHQYTLGEHNFRANNRKPTLPTELVPLVSAVSGLSDLVPEPQIARVSGRVGVPSAHRASDAEGLAPQGVPVSAISNGLVFSAQCWRAPQQQQFSGSGTGGYASSASYQGNRYGAEITNSAAGTLAPCGYQPSDIATAYNLNALYQQGLNGAGTTVAIVDAYGSTTIEADVAAFSAFMGLPPPNLTVIGTPTASNFSGESGWASETTLDVEWVHAVAPGAKIVLVVAPTNNDSDLFNADVIAATTPGVVSISNSWSSFDIGVAGDSEFYGAVDNILKTIGASGIGIQYSTGDYGDNAIQTGGGYTTTGWPASSPYTTGIGGVSVFLDNNKHVLFQTSWGTNLTEIADTQALGSPPLDVPFNEGFVFGGTGGMSDVYPKPSWQTGVPGNRRGTPDISWVADPYTGVEIIYTADAQGDLSIGVIGGTSVACPMFSALWGIATQRAHHKLGQAAPRLYHLPAGAITDVVAVSSQNNVTGTIQDAGGRNPLRASELAAPLYNLPSFLSAFYNSPFSTRWFVLGIGLDSTLAVGPGWDQATGLGTPNGAAFVNAFGGGD